MTIGISTFLVFLALAVGACSSLSDIPEAPTTYFSEEICEKETGCYCGDINCDFIPEGQTGEETCGKNFKKGWTCIDNRTGAIECHDNLNLFMERDPVRFPYKESFLDWCFDCLGKNGNPSISHDAGPFCNVKTGDGGVECVDSEDCQGHCIAEDENATSGTCSTFESLEDGCSYEFLNNKPVVICYS